MNIKGALIVSAITLVTMAIVFRVPAVKSVVLGA